MLSAAPICLTFGKRHLPRYLTKCIMQSVSKNRPKLGPRNFSSQAVVSVFSEVITYTADSLLPDEGSVTLKNQCRLVSVIERSVLSKRC